MCSCMHLVSSGTFCDMIKTLLDDIEREHSDKKSPYLLFARYLLLERCLPEHRTNSNRPAHSRLVYLLPCPVGGMTRSKEPRRRHKEVLSMRLYDALGKSFVPRPYGIETIMYIPIYLCVA